MTPKEQMNDLYALIEHHANLYYNEDNPEISDAEYDDLVKQLKELEKEHPEFVKPDFLTHRVGGQALFSITVSVPSVADLLDCDHGEYWGTHKWLGFGVSTGLSSVEGLVFDDGTAKVTLGESDITEAQSVGLTTAGQFVLYIKAEKVLAEKGQSFTLSYPGYEDMEISMQIVETGE